METFICKNCGKENPQDAIHNRVEKTFCDRKCFLEFQEKKRKAKAEAKVKEKLLSAQKYPPEQCERCVYGMVIWGVWGCNYFAIKKHTRHSLHPGGLPDECQEFERKKRGRPKKI